MSAASICVIIPAYNAEATITDAVRSALAEPEVAEVVVVDDASSDATARVADEAGAGDPRLTILTQPENRGPAAARNLAIARSRAPFLALLDADDYILPGRFAAMLRHGRWDLVADNIVFVPEDRGTLIGSGDLPASPADAVEDLDLAGFVWGNVPSPKSSRGELGFLKPVVSRAFLEEHGLSYDESLRLGEDFDLYARAMRAGARFRVIPNVGYVARVRPNSLSGRHRAGDLHGLLRASRDCLSGLAPTSAPGNAARAYLRNLSGRYQLHQFLETKRQGGLGAALREALAHPPNLVPISVGIARDKLAAARRRPPAPLPEQRYLIPPDRRPEFRSRQGRA